MKTNFGILFATALAAMTSSNASATIFLVDTSSDDGSAAFQICDADGGNANCSLRGAIVRANQASDLDAIEFSIPSSDAGYQSASDHWLLQVGSTALPALMQPVVIDGYTQLGASANTQSASQGGLNGVLKIEIQPLNPPNTQSNGLEIGANFAAASPTVIRGLAINQFASQIFMGGATADRIEGCYLGTTIDGSAAARPLSFNGGQGFGVRIFGQGAFEIGGMNPDSRNLLSGLRTAISGFSAINNIRVQGNLIGTNAAGDAVIGNRENGIATDVMTNSVIGGTDPDARNVISGNFYQALYFSSGNANAFNNTRIEGNYIGTDVTGTKAMGNGLNPPSPTQVLPTITVFANNSSPIEIGGSAPGQSNLIAHGGDVGVHLAFGRGARGSFNHYRGNRGIAWDNSGPFGTLPDGPNANDVGDADEGANRNQNYPALNLPPNFLPSGSTNVNLQYQVDTALANASYPITVNFFRGDCGGGPKMWMGSDTIEAVDAQASINFTLSSVDAGNVLPLLTNAVDANGNTSEFSAMIGDELFADGIEDEPATFSVGSCR